MTPSLVSGLNSQNPQVGLLMSTSFPADLVTCDEKIEATAKIAATKSPSTINNRL